MYTGYEVEDYFEEAIRAGLHGAISKTESKEKITQYIYHVLNGEILVDFAYFKQLMTQQKQSRLLPLKRTRCAHT